MSVIKSKAKILVRSKHDTRVYMSLEGKRLDNVKEFAYLSIRTANSGTSIRRAKQDANSKPN